MYERMSDGIFMEAGGTSTDISAICNGKVMVKYAQVGGHKTYCRSLDVRTLGVAGGSMIRLEKGKIAGVGPRSAHIAGLSYEVFSQQLTKPALELMAPCSGDEAEYVSIVDKQSGKKVALTLAGAANILGKMPEHDYAAGDAAAARICWQALGDALGITAEAAAQEAMDLVVGQLRKVVEQIVSLLELETAELLPTEKMVIAATE